VRIAWLLAIMFGCVCLVIPLRTVEAPVWEVSVVDPSGNPVSGVNVRETYKNYSAVGEEGEQDLITNEQGEVIFPEKKGQMSLFGKVIGVASSMTGGVHASFGRHAHVFAFGKCEGGSVKNGYVEDWSGYSAKNRSTIVCKTVGEK
jgi:hypothetical protein